ncbi:hypothetical protein Tco_1266390 [Tanacetum coccineum]
MKDQQDADAEITLIGSSTFDQEIEEAESDVDSMPGDEILSISREDNDEDESEKELSVVDEVVADNIIDELITEANKRDTNVSAATTNEEKKNTPTVKILNIHTLGAMRRFREIQNTKAPGSEPFSYLTRRVDFLAAQVHNLTKTLPDQFDDKMNSATSYVSRIIFDALAQRFPDLLSATIKNSLPQALTKAVRETLPGFNRRIKNSINDEMIEVLKTSVLKPMYKEFNALNKLETHRFIILKNMLRKSIHKTFGKSVKKNIHSHIGEEKKNIPRVKILNIHTLGAIRRFREIQITKALGLDPFSHLTRRVDFLATQVHNLTKTFPDQFDDKMNSATRSVSRIIFDALAQQFPDLLSATIKNSLPQALTKVVRETLPSFNRRIKNSINDEMIEVLKTSVLKPMYKEFNALNKLETHRFIILKNMLRKSIHKTFGKSVKKNIHSHIGEEKKNIPRVKILNIHTLGAIRRFREIQITKALGSDPFSHLTRRVDFLAAQFPDLLSATIKNSLSQALTKAVRETLPGFNRRIKNSINDEMIEVLKTSVLKPMYKEFNALNKLETHRFIILKNMLRKSIHKTFGKSVKKNIHSHIGEVNGLLRQCAKHQMQLRSNDTRGSTTQLQEVKRLSDLKAEREKSEKKLRMQTPVQLRAQEEELAEIKTKRIQHMNKMRDECHCINFRDDPLPITKFIYKVNKTSKIATMRITKNNQLLNLKIYDKFILKMLGFSEWLELHALASK